MPADAPPVPAVVPPVPPLPAAAPPEALLPPPPESVGLDSSPQPDTPHAARSRAYAAPVRRTETRRNCQAGLLMIASERAITVRAKEVPLRGAGARPAG